ncbi:MAG: sensor domain-containing protein [Actinomycetota bacterium]
MARSLHDSTRAHGGGIATGQAGDRAGDGRRGGRLGDMLAAPFRARTLRELGYALAALPLGVLWFTVMVTLLATGIGMAATLVGIPMLVGTMLLARFGSECERRWTRVALGVEIPAAAPFAVPPGAPWWKRGLRLLLDGARWREALYLVLLLPSGVVLFTVAVTVWSVALGLLTAPAWYWASAGDADVPWVGSGPGAVAASAGVVAVGAVTLLGAPRVVGRLVAAHLWMMGALLGPTRGELERHAAQAERQRDLAVGQIDADRRRVERDLHDGAQARLVSLAVDLGRARRRLEDGATPAEAVDLVRAAHEQAKQALDDVRNLARGIHPAILTDRGLDAALSSLAAGASVPVTLRSQLDGRLAAEVEAAAYFVVAEALTNVAKHSGATRAAVSAAVHDGALTVEVRDDGAGGARALPGSGLTGLEERVASLGGTLTVESPPGGPTAVQAVIPCG